MIPFTITAFISPWGGWGWGFNLEDYRIKGLKDDTPWLPFIANKLTPDELRRKPFFNKGSGEYDGIYVPEESYKIDSGSLEAQKHYHELLAEFFPARTFAAGHQGIGILYESRNIDINKNCKDLKNGWPEERINSRHEDAWLHNDMREISYLYVNKLFDAYVTTGGLNTP
ncbi:hypothetical protein JXC34_04890 [Candidatus Woesearchaeota archaeon]|nr:hypothetical protein [Candidatus Woesearchaeota archaeon]